MGALDKLIVRNKETQVEYPDMEGFEVTIAFLTRKELAALGKTCTKNKPGRAGMEQVFDNDKFLKLYTEKVIKDWSGLKGVYLQNFFPVEFESKEEAEQELPYTSEDAFTLVSNSSEFETWLEEVVSDVSNFTKSSMN